MKEMAAVTNDQKGDEACSVTASCATGSCSRPFTTSVYSSPFLLLPELTALMCTGCAPREKCVSVPSSVNSPCGWGCRGHHKRTWH